MSAAAKRRRRPDPDRWAKTQDRARIARAQALRRVDRAMDTRLIDVHHRILQMIEDMALLSHGRQEFRARAIAEKVGKCVRTVRLRMRQLEEWGYLDIVERHGRRGQQIANTYKIRRPKGVTPKHIVERRKARAERDRKRKAGASVTAPHERRQGAPSPSGWSRIGETIDRARRGREMAADDATEAPDRGAATAEEPASDPPRGGLQSVAPATRVRADPPRGEGDDAPSGAVAAGPPDPSDRCDDASGAVAGWQGVLDHLRRGSVAGDVTDAGEGGGPEGIAP